LNPHDDCGGTRAPPAQGVVGVSSVPQVAADAPKVMSALDFQLESTIDGKALKIASMRDEYTRESLH
jgi:putative transposase